MIRRPFSVEGDYENFAASVWLPSVATVIEDAHE
jgi:hypothetical protein